MKILFLSDDFPPKSFGGAGIITADLATEISATGHDVYVITTTQDRTLSGWRNYNGLKVFDLYTDYPQRLASYVSLYNYSAVKKVTKLIEEIKPGIIHAHNIHNYLSYECLKVARKYTDKVFLTTHDAMAFNYGKLVNFYDKKNLSVQKKFSYKVGFLQNLKTAKKRFNPIRNLFIRKYLNIYPRKIFTITDIQKEALTQNGIKNTVTVHYGVDCKKWEVSGEVKEAYLDKLSLRGKKIILFGGRLSEAKGGKVMIDVLKELTRRYNDARLLIAGTANDYALYLLNYAEKLGIRDKVVFTGWLPREDMKKAYSICDVVVTPSIYFDAFNIFNIEAGASSKPVVGTCFGGTPEIVLDGITGRIVNPNNIGMTAEAIFSIISDDKFAEKLGNAGRERVCSHFGLRRYATETLDQYLK